MGTSPLLGQYLPEHKMLSDDGLHGIIAPHIPVQTLTSKILHILDVDHQPLVLQLSTVLCLQQKTEAKRQPCSAVSIYSSVQKSEAVLPR